MNEHEIDKAFRRFRSHPLLGPASATLINLRDAAIENSDGWAYWSKPCRAAARLQRLIHAYWDMEREDVTIAQLRAAYAPIKAFRARENIDFEIIEPATGHLK